MSKNFTELYRLMLISKEMAEKSRDEFRKLQIKMLSEHKHAWFVEEISSDIGNLYYCPICHQYYRDDKDNEKINSRIEKQGYVIVFMYILSGEIKKANEELDYMYNMRGTTTCDLIAFSELIEQYGYKLDVDEIKIMTIEEFNKRKELKEEEEE